MRIASGVVAASSACHADPIRSRPRLRLRAPPSRRNAELAAAQRRAEAAEERAAAAENEAKSYVLQIEKLKFTIAKLRHMQFGQSAERGAILEQLELQLAGLEEDAARAQVERDAAAAAATKII